jgi:sigma-B regulation protein RsbU (phosphoserine phosphatase)
MPGPRDEITSRDELALLRDLYEHAPCGFLSTLADGTIVMANETFLSLTGHREEDLLGRMRFQDLLAIGDRLYYETHYSPLLRIQGSVREIAVTLKRADGGRLPVLAGSVFSEARAGKPDTIRTCLFPATDRREYERELLRARQRAEESESRARLLAQTLQQSLIPPLLPTIAGLEASDAYRPAGHGDEVGGDFYDLFETGPGEWGLILGDVSGKGAEAAVVTSLARYTVRAVAAEEGLPSAVLRRLNSALVRHGTDRFCTAVYAHIHRTPHGTFHLTVSLGGHPAPLHVTAQGEVAPLGRPGALLGVLDEVSTADEPTELAPGDAVLFFTDGVTEARDGEAFFEESRLRVLLAESPPLSAQEIVTQIMTTVLDFQHGLPSDDIALVALKVPARTRQAKS